MQTPRIRIRLTAMVVAAGLSVSCTTDTRYSQAQLDALQTREFDVPAGRAYAGVIGALLEQRYQIAESDLEGGLLVATSTSGDTWSGYYRSMVQIAVQPTGPSSSSVRISTSSGGQTRVDEDRIARLHERIDVHAHTPVTDLVWEPEP
ncbi:MAG: hypothetical protein ACYSWT_11885 [Planctomycetota bacterium]|jgi:hypothetical protein